MLRILVAPGEKLGFRVNPALEVLLVVPGGPADVAQIRVGDKVEEIDGTPVTTQAALAEALKAGDSPEGPGDTSAVRIEKRDLEGRTALHLSALAGSTKAVRASVSRLTSAQKPLPGSSTAVRQTPLTEILAPR